MSDKMKDKYKIKLMDKLSDEPGVYFFKYGTNNKDNKYYKIFVYQHSQEIEKEFIEKLMIGPYRDYTIRLYKENSNKILITYREDKRFDEDEFIVQDYTNDGLPLVDDIDETERIY